MAIEILYIFHVPFVSTAHLTQGTMSTLQFEVGARERGGAVYAEGLWLHVPEEEDQADPQDLRRLLDWARKNEFYFVRLDRDGDKVRELPRYNW